MNNRIRRHLLDLLLDPLPAARESGEWCRASGDCVCERCLLEFRLHPVDPRDEFLHVLCNGDRVKL